jgi:hypothetical protein
VTQNTSHAVMAQRAEPHDSLDDFPTPPWATRALMMHVLGDQIPKTWLPDLRVWEPAANRGFMAGPLGEYFGDVVTSDINDYGLGGTIQHDFLMGYKPDALFGKTIHWIVSNPPFRLAEQFIDRASKIANHGFAFLVRTSFLEGVGRYEGLFSKNPPSIVAQFSERVPMVKGRYDPEASTATSYCWLVWKEHQAGTRLMWIPPCRRQLERESDWPKREAA